jgi:hypothetical protein
MLASLTLANQQATRDPFYLDVGRRVLQDLEVRATVKCGLATVSNLLTKQNDDRMESFVLSETLKVGVSCSSLPVIKSTAQTYQHLIVSLSAI